VRWRREEALKEGVKQRQSSSDLGRERSLAQECYLVLPKPPMRDATRAQLSTATATERHPLPSCMSAQFAKCFVPVYNGSRGGRYSRPRTRSPIYLTETTQSPPFLLREWHVHRAAHSLLARLAARRPKDFNFKPNNDKKTERAENWLGIPYYGSVACAWLVARRHEPTTAAALFTVSFAATCPDLPPSVDTPPPRCVPG